MDIVEELSRIAQALEDAQVIYAVGGGLAVAIHGRPRLTIDIDMLVPACQMTSAIEAVAQAGFDIPTGWVTFPQQGLGIDRLYRLTKAIDTDFLTLDILEVDSPDNPLLVDRERLDLQGLTIAVLSRAALIRMKSNSSRTKDRLDVELLGDGEDGTGPESD